MGNVVFERFVLRIQYR